MTKEYTKQTMHNAISYNLLARTQPDIEQWLPATSHLAPLVLWFNMTAYGMEYPLGQFGSTILAVSLLLVHPQLLISRAI